MGKPAARLNDMHVCPMVTGTTPHVGGPVAGPGVPTVLIGGLPAAVVGDMCVCVGPPDSIAMGSTGVLIGGKPAGRFGDLTVHGGQIVAGCPTVLIGEAGGAGGGAGMGAAVAGKRYHSFPPSASVAGAIAGVGTGRPGSGAASTGSSAGSAAAEEARRSETSWARVRVTYDDGNNAAGVLCRVRIPTGEEMVVRTDAEGVVAIGGIPPGSIEVTLLEYDSSAIERR